jgi:deazaflavin-dependent oxidoreductase (nitroreductase family)
MAQPTARPFTAFEERLVNIGTKIMSRLNIWVIRLSGGRLGAKFRYGAPIMLLTTTGWKSGEPRTTPLLYLQDGATLVAVASKAGSARDPHSYRNLVAHPEVDVKIGRQHRRMRARPASAEEKQRLWPRLTTMYPPYDSYQARTARDIPVVILEPL